MKKNILLLSFLTLLFFPFIGKAYTVKSGEFVYIAKDEVVDGNLYFSAKSINVEGQILGDMIGVASNIQINGEVQGDLVGVSQSLIVNGTINGNLRAVSNLSTIDGFIEKNINFLGESLILGKNSIIGHDVLVKTIRTEIGGQINGSLHGASYDTLINGVIERNINLIVDKVKRKKYNNGITFGNNALVKGSLNYTGGKEVEVKEGVIEGTTKYILPVSGNYYKNNFSTFAYLFLSLLLATLVLQKLLRKQTEKIETTLIAKKHKILLPGIITLIVVPVAIFISAVTIIALPLSLITLGLFLLVLFLGKIIASLLAGKYFFTKILGKEKYSQHLQVLIGVLFVSVLLKLPVLGSILSFILSVSALGTAYHLFKKRTS